MEHSEDDIISKLRAGDESAYRYLFSRHYPIMCHIAAQYVQDDFLAEAIAGDIIFHIWEIRNSLSITTSLRIYLVRAVRNRCLDYLKSKRMQHELSISKASQAEQTAVSYINSDDYPLGRLLASEMEDRIANAIESLPDECRRVFKMSRFDGLSNHDIADRLGISVNTVKYHISHALQLLRTQLRQIIITAFVILIQN